MELIEITTLNKMGISCWSFPLDITKKTKKYARKEISDIKKKIRDTKGTSVFPLSVIKDIDGIPHVFDSENKEINYNPIAVIVAIEELKGKFLFDISTSLWVYNGSLEEADNLSEKSYKNRRYDCNIFDEYGKAIDKKDISNYTKYKIPLSGCLAHGFKICIENCKYFTKKEVNGFHCNFECPLEIICNKSCEYYYEFIDGTKHSCTYDDDNLCNIKGYDIYEKKKYR